MKKADSNSNPQIAVHRKQASAYFHQVLSEVKLAQQNVLMQLNSVKAAADQQAMKLQQETQAQTAAHQQQQQTSLAGGPTTVGGVAPAQQPQMMGTNPSAAQPQAQPQATKGQGQTAARPAGNSSAPVTGGMATTGKVGGGPQAAVGGPSAAAQNQLYLQKMNQQSQAQSQAQLQQHQLQLQLQNSRAAAAAAAAGKGGADLSAYYKSNAGSNPNLKNMNQGQGQGPTPGQGQSNMQSLQQRQAVMNRGVSQQGQAGQGQPGQGVVVGQQRVSPPNSMNNSGGPNPTYPPNAGGMPGQPQGGAQAQGGQNMQPRPMGSSPVSNMMRPSGSSPNPMSGGMLPTGAMNTMRSGPNTGANGGGFVSVGQAQRASPTQMGNGSGGQVPPGSQQGGSGVGTANGSNPELSSYISSMQQQYQQRYGQQHQGPNSVGKPGSTQNNGGQGMQQVPQPGNGTGSGQLLPRHKFLSGTGTQGNPNPSSYSGPLPGSGGQSGGGAGGQQGSGSVGGSGQLLHNGMGTWSNGNGQSGGAQGQGQGQYYSQAGGGRGGGQFNPSGMGNVPSLANSGLLLNNQGSGGQQGGQGGQMQQQGGAGSSNSNLLGSNKQLSLSGIHSMQPLQNSSFPNSQGSGSYLPGGSGSNPLYKGMPGAVNMNSTNDSILQRLMLSGSSANPNAAPGKGVVTSTSNSDLTMLQQHGSQQNLQQHGMRQSQSMQNLPVSGVSNSVIGGDGKQQPANFPPAPLLSGSRSSSFGSAPNSGVASKFGSNSSPLLSHSGQYGPGSTDPARSGSGHPGTGGSSSATVGGTNNSPQLAASNAVGSTTATAGGGSGGGSATKARKNASAKSKQQTQTSNFASLQPVSGGGRDSSPSIDGLDLTGTGVGDDGAGASTSTKSGKKDRKRGSSAMSKSEGGAGRGDSGASGANGPSNKRRRGLADAKEATRSMRPEKARTSTSSYMSFEEEFLDHPSMTGNLEAYPGNIGASSNKKVASVVNPNIAHPEKSDDTNLDMLNARRKFLAGRLADTRRKQFILRHSGSSSLALSQLRRLKTRWDYVVEESQWMAIDMFQERRWMQRQARVLAHCCAEKAVASQLMRTVVAEYAAVAAASGQTMKKRQTASMRSTTVDGLNAEQWDLIGDSWGRFVSFLSCCSAYHKQAMPLPEPGAAEATVASEPSSQESMCVETYGAAGEEVVETKPTLPPAVPRQKPVLLDVRRELANAISAKMLVRFEESRLAKTRLNALATVASPRLAKAISLGISPNCNFSLTAPSSVKSHKNQYSGNLANATIVSIGSIYENLCTENILSERLCTEAKKVTAAVSAEAAGPLPANLVSLVSPSGPLSKQQKAACDQIDKLMKNNVGAIVTTGASEFPSVDEVRQIMAVIVLKIAQMLQPARSRSPAPGADADNRFVMLYMPSSRCLQWLNVLSACFAEQDVVFTVLNNQLMYNLGNTPRTHGAKACFQQVIGANPKCAHVFLVVLEDLPELLSWLKSGHVLTGQTPAETEEGVGFRLRGVVVDVCATEGMAGDPVASSPAALSVLLWSIFGECIMKFDIVFAEWMEDVLGCSTTFDPSAVSSNSLSTLGPASAPLTVVEHYRYNKMVFMNSCTAEETEDAPLCPASLLYYVSPLTVTNAIYQAVHAYASAKVLSLVNNTVRAGSGRLAPGGRGVNASAASVTQKDLNLVSVDNFPVSYAYLPCCLEFMQCSRSALACHGSSGTHASSTPYEHYVALVALLKQSIVPCVTGGGVAGPTEQLIKLPMSGEMASVHRQLAADVRGCVGGSQEELVVSCGAAIRGLLHTDLVANPADDAYNVDDAVTFPCAACEVSETALTDLKTGCSPKLAYLVDFLDSRKSGSSKKTKTTETGVGAVLVLLSSAAELNITASYLTQLQHSVIVLPESFGADEGGSVQGPEEALWREMLRLWLGSGIRRGGSTDEGCRVILGLYASVTCSRAEMELFSSRCSHVLLLSAPTAEWHRGTADAKGRAAVLRVVMEGGVDEQLVSGSGSKVGLSTADIGNVRAALQANATSSRTRLQISYGSAVGPSAQLGLAARMQCLNNTLFSTPGAVISAQLLGSAKASEVNARLARLLEHVVVGRRRLWQDTMLLFPAGRPSLGVFFMDRAPSESPADNGDGTTTEEDSMLLLRGADCAGDAGLGDELARSLYWQRPSSHGASRGENGGALAAVSSPGHRVAQNVAGRLNRQFMNAVLAVRRQGLAIDHCVYVCPLQAATVEDSVPLCHPVAASGRGEESVSFSVEYHNTGLEPQLERPAEPVAPGEEIGVAGEVAGTESAPKKIPPPPNPLYSRSKTNATATEVQSRLDIQRRVEELTEEIPAPGAAPPAASMKAHSGGQWQLSLNKQRFNPAAVQAEDPANSSHSGHKRKQGLDKLLRYRNGKRIRDVSLVASGSCLQAIPTALQQPNCSATAAAATLATAYNKTLPAYDLLPSWKGRMEPETSMNLEPWKQAEDKAILGLIKDALAHQHLALSAAQRNSLCSEAETAPTKQPHEHLYLYPPPVYADGCVLSSGSSTLARSAINKQHPLSSHAKSVWFMEFLLRNCDAVMLNSAMSEAGSDGVGGAGSTVRSSRQIRKRMGVLYQTLNNNSHKHASKPPAPTQGEGGCDPVSESVAAAEAAKINNHTAVALPLAPTGEDNGNKGYFHGLKYSGLFRPTLAEAAALLPAVPQAAPAPAVPDAPAASDTVNSMDVSESSGSKPASDAPAVPTPSTTAPQPVRNPFGAILKLMDDKGLLPVPREPTLDGTGTSSKSGSDGVDESVERKGVQAAQDLVNTQVPSPFQIMVRERDRERQRAVAAAATATASSNISNSGSTSSISPATAVSGSTPSSVQQSAGPTPTAPTHAHQMQQQQHYQQQNQRQHQQQQNQQQLQQRAELVSQQQHIKRQIQLLPQLPPQ